MDFTNIEVAEEMGQSWIELVRHLYGGDETQCTLEAFAEKGTHVMRLIGTVRIMGAPILSMASRPPYSTCEIHYPFLIESGDIMKRRTKMSGREKEELEGVTLLGNQGIKYPDDYAPEVLETFLNKHPDNDYFVKFNCPEFTSLCPITGQPDFATIYISYVPDKLMVESKSLKLYLFSFRNHGDFHEDCVNIIMKDLIKLMEPKYIEVWGKFTPRGGISIDPYCNYGRLETKWEEVAWNRLANHDLYPEKIDNR